MSNARQRVSIYDDACKRYKITISYRIDVSTGNYLRILFPPFRSFLQLVGDLDELKKKDYPEISKGIERIKMGGEVSKGNTWIPFCMKKMFFYNVIKNILRCILFILIRV